MKTIDDLLEYAINYQEEPEPSYGGAFRGTTTIDREAILRRHDSRSFVVHTGTAGEIAWSGAIKATI